MTTFKRGPGIRLTANELERLKIMLTAGKSTREIRAELKCSSTAVWYYRRILGLPPAPRGLAAISPERRSEIARLGGKATSKDRDHMSRLGKIGGAVISKDREFMRKIGQKGGSAVSQDRERMRKMGKRGAKVRWKKEKGNT